MASPPSWDCTRAEVSEHVDKFDYGLDDDDVPGGQPPSRGLPNPKSKFEMNQDDDYEGPPQPHGQTEMVDANSPMAPYFKLYRWHPFTELFCVIAEWFEDVEEVNLTKGQLALKQRAKLKQEHPIMFRGAVTLDLLLLLLVVIVLCSAVIYIALSAVGVNIETIKIPIPWFN